MNVAYVLFFLLKKYRFLEIVQLQTTKLSHFLLKKGDLNFTFFWYSLQARQFKFEASS